MINNPQSTPFPQFADVGASAAPDAPAAAASGGSSSPAAAGDAIGGRDVAAALGATLLDAAQSLAAAQHGGLDPGAATARASATSGLEATLARMLGDAAGTPAGAPLANPALAHTVLALALQPSATGLPAGVPPRALAALVDVAALLRTAGSAQTPAASALALQRLTALLGERRDDVASAAAALQTQAPNRSENAVAIPWWDPHFRTLHRSRAEAPRARPARDDAAEARLRAVPERDRRGRPYTPGERARLAELGLDPRTGFAPEAEAALAAEAQLGLRFTRASVAHHDFVDETASAWDVVAPLEPAGLEAPLRSLAREANVLADAAGLAPAGVPALHALAGRLTDAGGVRRIVVVRGEDAEAWR